MFFGIDKSGMDFCCEYFQFGVDWHLAYWHVVFMWGIVQVGPLSIWWPTNGKRINYFLRA